MSACALTPMPALAQTASILPNARTQFINANGQPVVGGTVGFYIPSTLTSKTTWQDVNETTPNTNPVTLDALGTAKIWGSGLYREIVRDSSGNLIWDAVTSGSTSNSIGTINGILQANGTGTVSAVTIGSGLTYAGGTLSAVGGGGGGLSTVFDVVNSFGGDPTGATDNTTAYNSAKSACAAAHGGIIYFGAGTFKFTSRITNAAVGCSILGAGQTATVFSPTGISGDFLTVSCTGVSAITLSNLRITNGGSWTSGYALNWQCSLGIASNLWIDLTPQGIHHTNTIDAYFEHIHINDTSSTSPIVVCDNAVGDVFGSHWSDVDLGQFSGLPNVQTGFHIGAGCNSFIASHSLSGPGLNVCLDNGTTAGSFITLDDFACDHDNYGIIINGGGGFEMVNSFLGSTLIGSGLTFANTYQYYATITGTQIRDNAFVGVDWQAGSGLTLTGNVISGNLVNVNIPTNISNFNVTGNTFNVFGDAPSTGVLVNSGSSDHYVIANNLCITPGGACVLDAGSGVNKFVSGNVGP